MEPADVKPSRYIDFDLEYNDKDPRFEVLNHVRISRHKLILQKITLQIGLRKFFGLKKIKTLFCRHLSDKTLMERMLLELFLKNNCKR